MTTSLPDRDAVGQFVRYLLAKHSPPDPKQTLFLSSSEFQKNSQALSRDRYVGITPVFANSVSAVRDAILAQGDMDCLILNYHGTPIGEVNLNNSPKLLSQLANDLGSGLPKVRKHIIFEGCVVGRKPTQMNAFAKKFRCPSMDGSDRFAAQGLAFFDRTEPPPRNEADKSEIRQMVASELEKTVREVTPDVTDFRKYILGGGADEYERIEKSIGDALIKKGKVSREIDLEWFALFEEEPVPSHEYRSYREMKQALAVVDNQAAAEDIDAQYNSILNDTDHPGRIVRVKTW